MAWPSFSQSMAKLFKQRPWEEETGVWSYPEAWIQSPVLTWQKGYLAEGLGEKYNPTLPSTIPEYPSLAEMIDTVLNLRKIESTRKGRASTRVTRGDLGDLFTSKTGLFPL